PRLGHLHVGADAVGVGGHPPRHRLPLGVDARGGGANQVPLGEDPDRPGAVDDDDGPDPGFAHAGGGRGQRIVGPGDDGGAGHEVGNGSHNAHRRPDPAILSMLMASISDPGEATSPWLTAAQAAARLGVKPQTLYAYVSRGLVRSDRLPGPGRTSRYDRSDIERLAGRRRAGGRAGALELFVDTELTLIEPVGRLLYRG